MAGSLLAILQTRLELAAVELEEESLRLFSYLLLALVALFCLFIAVSLGIVLVIALCWETSRIGAITGLMVFFAVLAVALGIGIRSCYRRKPRLLAYSREELSKDIDRLNPSRGNRNRQENA